MKICPKCGKVVSYNSYFGAYICTECDWEDATIGQKRNMGCYYTSKKLTVKVKNSDSRSTEVTKMVKVGV